MSNKPRFLLLVLDGCGAGELPDAVEFGDGDFAANTLAHTADAVGGLTVTNLQRLGLGNITPIQGVAPEPNAPAAWGRLAEISRGKDTVTGHWEMVGVHTRVAFPTYPQGFPPDVIAAFEQITGRGTLGNYPASGTEIIKILGEEHVRTGSPILYTSADSVFQVAAHEDPAIFGLERLYDVCEKARRMLQDPHHVGRVIARPFVGTDATTFKRTENRRDYPLPAPHDTVLDTLTAAGKHVHAVGKIGEIFGGRGITTSDKTTNNPDHIAAILRFLRGEGAGADADFLFANLEDFDMLYGHRNDPVGFARLLTEFDTAIGEMLPLLHPGDLLAITADHGNDPTTPSTDHSREYAPLLMFGPPVTKPTPLGDRATFGDWGATVSKWLGAPLPALGTPLPDF
ncbi:MAG: phosphopentomutase [Akkermansiaceae bacterium]|nr:phosphopentomutase [Armatimonadota bacterium]